VQVGCEEQNTSREYVTRAMLAGGFTRFDLDGEHEVCKEWCPNNV
jgi:hypothetical protein